MEGGSRIGVSKCACGKASDNYATSTSLPCDTLYCDKAIIMPHRHDTVLQTSPKLPQQLLPQKSLPLQLSIANHNSVLNCQKPRESQHSSVALTAKGDTFPRNLMYCGSTYEDHQRSAFSPQFSPHSQNGQHQLKLYNHSRNLSNEAEMIANAMNEDKTKNYIAHRTSQTAIGNGQGICSNGQHFVGRKCVEKFNCQSMIGQNNKNIANFNMNSNNYPTSMLPQSDVLNFDSLPSLSKPKSQHPKEVSLLWEDFIAGEIVTDVKSSVLDMDTRLSAMEMDATKLPIEPTATSELFATESVMSSSNISGNKNDTFEVSPPNTDEFWICRICRNPDLKFKSFDEMLGHHSLCIGKKKKTSHQQKQQPGEEVHSIANPSRPVNTLLSPSNGDCEFISGGAELTHPLFAQKTGPKWNPLRKYNEDEKKTGTSNAYISSNRREPILDRRASDTDAIWGATSPLMMLERTQSGGSAARKKGHPSNLQIIDRKRNGLFSAKPGRNTNVFCSGMTKPDRNPEQIIFEPLIVPLTLSLKDDSIWLTPLHCFVRKYCVELFTTSHDDVLSSIKGKRRRMIVDQVGIRCPHCHKRNSSISNSLGEKNAENHFVAFEKGSTYFPSSVHSIYNATMNLLQRHFHSCPGIPTPLVERYKLLKSDDARSATSKKYWVDSARQMGFIDTPEGIRYCPSLRKTCVEVLESKPGIFPTHGIHSDGSNKSGMKKQDNGSDNPQMAMSSELRSANGLFCLPPEPTATSKAPLLVLESDKVNTTKYSYFLMQQMQRCTFTEADRLGKRKGFEPGFSGLACRYCFGGFGAGRFFPSSIKTLSDTSKTLNVLHSHLMKCRKCPAETKEKLAKLRTTHEEERQALKFGSQKAFFTKIWTRLHGKEPVHSESVFPISKTVNRDCTSCT